MNQLVLDKFKISNFRNLNDQLLSFAPKVNCIFGENGNGKTNILEAIYLVLHHKSFRKNTAFPQYIGLDSEEPEIFFQSSFKINNEKDIAYSGKVNNLKNIYFLNGKESKRLVGLSCVFINPFDSYGFHHTPTVRRKWMDRHVGLIDNEYRSILNRYNKALRFRNSLVQKKPLGVLSQLKAINLELAKDTEVINKLRMNFLAEISPIMGEVFQNLFSEECHLQLRLVSKMANQNSDQIFQALQNNNEKDLITGRSELGPHRDDYLLLFNDLNAFEVCSLGQQKMSFLSLIFAYIQLFKYKFKTYPLVLIDDVSGELDKTRWSNLISYLCQHDFQTIITTANEDFRTELEKISGANKLFVVDGDVSQLHG